MMFMMPMPPTAQGYGGDCGEQQGQGGHRGFLGRRQVGEVAHREVVVLGRLQPMPLAQQINDLVLHVTLT